MVFSEPARLISEPKARFPFRQFQGQANRTLNCHEPIVRGSFGWCGDANNDGAVPFSISGGIAHVDAAEILDAFQAIRVMLPEPI